MILSNAKLYTNAGSASYNEITGAGFKGAQLVKGQIPTKDLKYISGICDNESLIRFDIYVIKGFFPGLDNLAKGDACGIKFLDGAVEYTIDTIVASAKVVKHEGNEILCLQLTPAEAVALNPKA